MGLITIQEAAIQLQRSQTRVRKFLAEERLTGEKIGRDWVVDEDSVATFKMGLAKPITKALRLQVLARDSYACQECGVIAETGYQINKLHVHHVISRDSGGTNNLDNLVTNCSKCHMKKHPKSAEGVIGSGSWVSAPALKIAQSLAKRLGCTETEVIERALQLLDSELGSVEPRMNVKMTGMGTVAPLPPYITHGSGESVEVCEGAMASGSVTTVIASKSIPDWRKQRAAMGPLTKGAR